MVLAQRTLFRFPAKIRLRRVGFSGNASSTSGAYVTEVLEEVYTYLLSPNSDLGKHLEMRCWRKRNAQQTLEEENTSPEMALLC
jgi:hypothetical protein